MNLKLTNFSTIIIVNKNQEQTKSIRVKTKHLKRIKHYVVSIVCFIIALAGTIIYLTSKNNSHEQEKQQLLTQKPTQREVEHLSRSAKLRYCCKWR